MENLEPVIAFGGYRDIDLTTVLAHSTVLVYEFPILLCAYAAGSLDHQHRDGQRRMEAINLPNKSIHYLPIAFSLPSIVSPLPNGLVSSLGKSTVSSLNFPA